MPLGIGMSVATCCIFYMLISSVVVGLVPYNELDPDTPISSAFASYGMGWAVYVILLYSYRAMSFPIQRNSS